MILVDYQNLIPLPLVMNPDGRTFVLADDVAFNIGSEKTPVLLIVPKGFDTDLASVPPAAGLVGFEKLGRHSWAALLHDYMYATTTFSYEVANAIFYQELRRSGVGHFKAVLMALAVQIGGKRIFNRNVKRLAESYAR